MKFKGAPELGRAVGDTGFGSDDNVVSPLQRVVGIRTLGLGARSGALPWRTQ